MFYGMAATAVLAIHAAFILFVLLGGLVAAWRPWMAAVHIPAAIWGCLIEATGGVCPLTTLENGLRARAGLAQYEGDFIGHFLLGVVYPDGLTRTAQYGLAVGVVVVNAVIYGWICLRYRRAGR